jgi:hypothetical protein
LGLDSSTSRKQAKRRFANLIKSVRATLQALWNASINRPAKAFPGG